MITSDQDTWDHHLKKDKNSFRAMMKNYSLFAMTALALWMAVLDFDVRFAEGWFWETK
jgi:hypothetical protein